jgi:hypothetical protein
MPQETSLNNEYTFSKIKDRNINQVLFKGEGGAGTWRWRG